MEKKKIDEKELKEQLKKINDNFEKLLKSKQSKEVKPRGLGRSALKKGLVNYIYIRENGNMDVLKIPISEVTTVYDGSPRLATPEYVLNWKGKPTIIQPSWSTEPYSPVRDFEQSARDKMLAVGWRLLANRQEQGDIKQKRKLSGGLIFAIIIGLIVGGYLLLT